MNKRINKIGLFLEDKSPTIFAGIGIAGVISTSYLTAKAMPKVMIVLEFERNKNRYATKEVKDDISFKEKVLLTWRYFVPAAISGSLTISAMVLSHQISSRRSAALAGLYSLSEAALHEYKDKVVEVLGEKKEEKLMTAIHEDRLRKDPVENKEIIRTGLGEYLFYDSLSGRYFMSDVEKIRRVQNEFNSVLLRDMYLPLNDFYIDIGLEPTELGRNIGWDVDNGLLEIKFVAILATTGEPCVSLEYNTKPRFL